MVRTILSFAMVLLAGSQSPGQTVLYDVHSDAALDKPVSLHVRFGSLDSVLKTLSRKSGVDIEASGLIGSTKVSIFATDTPCRLLLTQLASVLDAQWKNLSGIRFIAANTGSERNMNDYLAAEDKQQRQHAEEELDGIFKRVEAEAQSTPEPENPTSSGGSPLPLHNGRAGLGMNRAMIADEIGLLLQHAGAADLDQFWKGAYAAVEVGPENSQPSTVPGIRRRPQVPRGPAEPAMVYGRYDYYGTHTLQIGSSRFPLVTQRFDVPELLKPEGTLADSKFGKAVLAWPKLSAEGQKGFDQPIQEDNSKPVGFGAVENHTTGPAVEPTAQPTLTDLLEKFHQLTHLPVIADAFRTTLPINSQEPKGGTPVEWLTSLAQNTGAFVRIEDGIAGVRQGGFWRLRQYEIPESAISAMAAIASKKLVGDYAAFFAALTPAQAKLFDSSTPPELPFSTANLSDAIPALRLIGTLGTNFPVNGQPVPVSALGADSQGLVGQAIAESVFSGHMWIRNNPGTAPKQVFISLKPKDVQQPDGTVAGVSLEILLPIGQTVEFDVPLKLPD